MSNKLIALTGGGTAGHVMPHFAILPHLKEQGWSCYYIGSAGIEKKLVAGKGIEFHTIKVGKLRRYISFQNFLDIFRLAFGLFQSILILILKRPHCVFSKGGYVSVPVCIAAWCLRIKVVTHESDLTPGLATKIIARFANQVLCTFPETMDYLNPKTSQWVGAAVRSEILSGDRSAGLKFLGFSQEDDRQIILFMGGSLGAHKINKALNLALPELTKKYRIVHLTGKGKQLAQSIDGYKSYEFLGSELGDVFAACDAIVSRAGANSIFEFLSLSKPMLLIPLVAGSRGDQVHNADNFAKHGWCKILSEGDLSKDSLIKAIDFLVAGKEEMMLLQKEYRHEAAIGKIITAIVS